MPVITKRFLDAIKPDGTLRIIRDDDLIGFGVQVTPAGHISFCATYRVGTKSRRRVIGRFGPMTVDQARKAALAVLATAANGEDPHPATPINLTTVAGLFDAWMQQHVVPNLEASSAGAYRDCFETHCRSRFGHLPPLKLDRVVIAEAHADMKATPTAANHMLRTMRAMFSWAERQQLLAWPNGNPTRGHTLNDEQPSERILTVPEIRTFITLLPKAAMDEATRHMLMLELLLGQRSGEVAAMRKAGIDLVGATWTLDADQTKAKRRHIVPLPPWSREIIAAAMKDAKDADGAYLFPSPVRDPAADDAAPIAGHAMFTALRRAQRPIDKAGRPAPHTDDDTWVFDFRDRAMKPSPISPHDLRRTCSSYLELLGHGDFVRGAILNHSRRRNVTAKHYSAADLLKLKRTALLQWEAAVRRIVAGEDPFASRLEDDRAEEQRLLAPFVDAAPAK